MASGKVLCFLARVRGDFFAHEAARKTFYVPISNLGVRSKLPVTVVNNSIAEQLYSRVTLKNNLTK